MRNGVRIIVALLLSLSAGYAESELITDDLRVFQTARFHGDVVLEPYTTDVPTNGLVLYFTMNTNESGVVSDISGENNNGSVYNGALWTSNGYDQGAYVFNMTGGITVADQPSLGMVDAVTVAFWIYDETFNPYARVVEKKGTSNDRGTFAVELGAGRFIRWTTRYSSYSKHTDTSYATVPTGQWNFVTTTYDSQAGIKQIYINGILDSSFSRSSTLYARNLGLNIGFNEWMPLQGVDGRIDEIMIFNRALDEDEVMGLYTSGGDYYGHFSAQAIDLEQGVNQQSHTATNVFQGKVGIGTDAPQAPLHVVGDSQLDGHVDVSGNLDVGGAITGDGSGLVNLNVPTPSLADTLAQGAIADRDIDMNGHGFTNVAWHIPPQGDIPMFNGE